MPATLPATASWHDVCPLVDLVAGLPTGALVAGRQIALVRFDQDTVFAVSNFDPFSRAMVMARGIVGDVTGVPMLASPIYKQRFDLRTGRCFDDPAVSIPAYPVELRNGTIRVSV